MDDATLARDLLLGRNKIQMRRVATSSHIKFFMRPTNKKKDVKFLIELAKYLAKSVQSTNWSHTIYDLDLPGGDENDFIVLEIICAFGSEADAVEIRWKEYEGVAFSVV